MQIARRTRERAAGDAFVVSFSTAQRRTQMFSEQSIKSQTLLHRLLPKGNQCGNRYKLRQRINRATRKVAITLLTRRTSRYLRFLLRATYFARTVLENIYRRRHLHSLCARITHTHTSPLLLSYGGFVHEREPPEYRLPRSKALSRDENTTRTFGCVQSRFHVHSRERRRCQVVGVAGRRARCRCGVA